MSVIRPTTSRPLQSGLESVNPEPSRVPQDQSSATSAHLPLSMVSSDTLVYIETPVDGIQDDIHGQRTDVLFANVLSAYRHSIPYQSECSCMPASSQILGRYSKRRGL
jgi:hypothetical protein